MRLEKYLLEEWKLNKGYAGRSISKSIDNKDLLIVWIYLLKPKYIGLLYTLPNGKTFLDGKYIGSFNTSNLSTATHRIILNNFKNILKIDYNIDDNYENNIRGRIIKDDFYVYDYDKDYGITRPIYNKTVDFIYKSFKKYLDDNWWENK